MTEKYMPTVWIIIGVSGSGKTTIGRLLAERLECDFLEGDRRHSASNIQKMAAQIPLTEADRQTWLDAIANDIHRAMTLNRETVITCSALKRTHRQRFVNFGPVQLVWLKLPEPNLRRRLAQRKNHYMQANLLDSQLDAFDAIGSEEAIIAVDATQSPSDVLNQIWGQAVERYPQLKQVWWQR